MNRLLTNIAFAAKQGYIQMILEPDVGLVGRFFTWLREPPEGLIQALNAIMLIPMKICYVSYRSALRLAIGRTRRDRMRFTGRSMLKQVSPSLYLVK